MKTLIARNFEYLGPKVVTHLRQTMAETHLVGFDSVVFAHVLTNALSLPERMLNEQRPGDIRNPSAFSLEDFGQELDSTRGRG